MDNAEIGDIKSRCKKLCFVCSIVVVSFLQTTFLSDSVHNNIACLRHVRAAVMHFRDKW